MIIAKCTSSNSPATIIASPNDMMATSLWFPNVFNPAPMRRAATTPKAVAPSQMPMDFSAIIPILRQSIP